MANSVTSWPLARGETTWIQPRPDPIARRAPRPRPVANRTLRYLRSFASRRVFGWLWRKHREASRGISVRRYCEGGWWPHVDGVWLFNPTRDRDHSVPLPGSSDPNAVGERGDVNEGVTTGLVESRMR
jgi:hypothetical protein